MTDNFHSYNSLAPLRPPSNAEVLGSQLLGYRVYIRELACSQDPCVEKKTISEPGKRSARIGLLSKLSDISIAVLTNT